MAFLETEQMVEDLFDEVYPPTPNGERSFKPLLGTVLGCAVVDVNVRRLHAKREYNRLDFVDFLDYATSGLAAPPRLRDFAPNTISFYDGFDRSPPEPMMLGTQNGDALSILGAAIARNDLFVSVTMHFTTHGTGGTENQIATITFAPPQDNVSRGEDAHLQEWDRYTVLAPVSDDPEWRFMLSGTYTDYLLEAMEASPNEPPSLSAQKIASIRDGGRLNKSEYRTFFELARLGLHLPAYFSFMYDLVVREDARSRPVPSSQATNAEPSPTVRDRPNPDYRVVKSLRVVRVGTPSQLPRTWSAPSYRFAVRGHWRHYTNPAITGKSAEGRPVVGRTWIRTYLKGPGPSIDDTTTSVAEPRVTIQIKQPLSYARDVIAAHERDGSRIHAQPKAQSSDAPSEEWRAFERSKLTAGLRYTIMRRDAFRCCLCGRNASEENAVRLEVDHKTPVSSWGRTVEENLWTLCVTCNRGKSSKPVE